MPRKARIDASGALQRTIVRGIARKRIFYDGNEGDNFVARLSAILPESAARRYARRLIPNLLNLLFHTGKAPTSTEIILWTFPK